MTQKFEEKWVENMSINSLTKDDHAIDTADKLVNIIEGKLIKEMFQ